MGLILLQFMRDAFTINIYLVSDEYYVENKV